ncbi:hypothetical protein [Deinococcus aquatilis]|uniref:hypothetical protein n=1 Tax=Deinococcus aquatilis TaxID=519440 RepID=UPI001FE1834A|nr:hypothetical protein [Deinococcus aquatilis]
MKRALERYLGRPARNSVRKDDEAQVLEAVVFTDSTRQMLIQQLEVKGQWQGGVLFGERTLETLTVHFAAPLGPPAWSGQPLHPHLPYLIGWSDSVSAQHSEALDWCGNWIAAPNSRLPDERLDLSWLQLGVQQGLFDDIHPLVVVGIEDGLLSSRSYLWDEDAAVTLPGQFENREAL